MPGTILVADDDQSIRTVLEQALARANYVVRSTGNAATLYNWVLEGLGDIILTDVVMPDENGLDLLPRIKKIRPELPVVVMSAQNTLLTAIKATERGAYDYLPKPFDLKVLLQVVERALSKPKKAAKRSGAEEEDETKTPLIGRSPAMQEIYRVLARLMGTDLTVLVSGESGTGKELVARALHEYGKRKGAFTGADSRAIGRFEQAQGGTLFLDEIGDMPIEAQTRLLRVLQQGEYTTVGGRTAIRTDVRIVAATNRDLRQFVRQGLFREDLYYRLNVVPLRLPPLRERAEDIPDLVRHFLAQAMEEGLPVKSIDKESLEALKKHKWPGNVRELENLVRRLAALYSDDVINLSVIQQELQPQEIDDTEEITGSDESLGMAVERHVAKYFAAHSGSLPPSGLYERVIREVERPLLSLSLEATNGNQIKAADLLGVNRNTLRKKIRELDIQVVRGLK